jgi:hypothetical protein
MTTDFLKAAWNRDLMRLELSTFRGQDRVLLLTPGSGIETVSRGQYARSEFEMPILVQSSFRLKITLSWGSPPSFQRKIDKKAGQNRCLAHAMKARLERRCKRALPTTRPSRCRVP